MGSSYRGPCLNAKGLKDYPVGDIKPLKEFSKWHWHILIQDELSGEMVKEGGGEDKIGYRYFKNLGKKWLRVF